MIARVQQCRDRQMQRRHAARRADRADAAFQRREPFLEHRRGRVGNPGIDVPSAFQIEQRRGMLGILKDVGSGLIDRDCTSARHGIRMLAGMEAQGVKGGRLGCGHAELEKRWVLQPSRAALGCAIKALGLLAPGLALPLPSADSRARVWGQEINRRGRQCVEAE
ncbi:hypothetical protein GALL_428610 [mine drainage metagenome]|uniref:Uncharacterized protein n=1 Tax=mine drainage metagenome TaxID=410659 RepID=A0A1J5QD95_9ZZZZ